MDSLYLALNNQNIDYTKIPDLIFNTCQNELNLHAPRKKSTFLGIINLSWLKRCLSVSWKVRVLETDYETKKCISSQKREKQYYKIKWKEHLW